MKNLNVNRYLRKKICHKYDFFFFWKYFQKLMSEKKVEIYFWIPNYGKKVEWNIFWRCQSQTPIFFYQNYGSIFTNENASLRLKFYFSRTENVSQFSPCIKKIRRVCRWQFLYFPDSSLSKAYELEGTRCHRSLSITQKSQYLLLTPRPCYFYIDNDTKNLRFFLQFNHIFMISK